MSNKLPDIKNEFSEWYNEIVYKAELADHAPVRGCMVIRPYGYALWENIKAVLDKKIKDTGHHNAAFPLLIPLSFLQKEAQHVEGFSPELAIVTHAGGKELEEPLVVRPTSETIIHYMFAQWLKSWRDLPIKINQWASVVRWEMRTRPFLRTTEFYWQEGHTAHETAQEAEKEAQTMLSEYVDLAENYLAVPVVAGIKSESEKFAGADKTYTFEGLMPDGKALQMGTSHIISQNFAKAFGMTFQGRDGVLQFPFLTSWGATTRLIGALVMTHGDQKGLVLPPKVAPIQVVLIPIFKAGADPEVIKETVRTLAQQLQDAGVRTHVDSDEHATPGAKFFTWELKGVPLRIELGPRDIEKRHVVIADRLGSAKEMVSWESLVSYVQQKLSQMQDTLLANARERLKTQWYSAQHLTEFGPRLDTNPGFYQTGWCRRKECENVLKEYKATIRCLLDKKTFATCFNCDNESPSDILVAKSY